MNWDRLISRMAQNRFLFAVGYRCRKLLPKRLRFYIKNTLHKEHRAGGKQA